MKGQKVVVLGGSGLTGRAAIRALQAAGHALLCPLRRPLDGLSPAQTLLAGADGRWDAVTLAQRFAAFAPAAVIACLGTTRRAAGSLAAFAAIDRDLVLQLLAAATRAGASQLVLLSSVGADAASGNAYLRIKGETERGVQQLGARRVDLLRPSLLLGQRGESRPLEQLGIAASGLLVPLLRGAMRRYRPIAAEAVAAAAVALLQERAAGVFVHEFDALTALAARTR
jgi:uncharacterized protein YbjT (DUF2867 family)